MEDVFEAHSQLFFMIQMSFAYTEGLFQLYFLVLSIDLAMLRPIRLRLILQNNQLNQVNYLSSRKLLLVRQLLAYGAVLLPINAWKISKQVHGKDALNLLLKKTKTYGVSALYQGSIAEFISTTNGHYSWFLLHNYLQLWLPKYSYKDEFSNAVLRSALVGFLSTLGSDFLVNSFRVVKTFKQAVSENWSYGQVFQQIIKKDGFQGIFFRGLLTKILLNMIQGTSLTVSWKLMEYRLKDSIHAGQ